METIDAHQHYWTLQRGDYAWLTPDIGSIYRDFGPADLAPHRVAAGIVRTVLVQATDTLAETEFLLSLAEKENSVAAVVGWVDLGSQTVTADLQRLAAHAKFKGIRPMLQDIEDSLYILRPEVLAILESLPALGLRFDALIQPRHLPVITALADRIPELAIVVDHGAKPFIAGGILEPWLSDMSALGKRVNVFVKLSGLVTEAGGAGDVEKLRPYADHLLNVFGPARVMFGSDWPVVELAATYAEWHEAAGALVSHLSESARGDIFSGTARRFYGI